MNFGASQFLEAAPSVAAETQSRRDAMSIVSTSPNRISPSEAQWSVLSPRDRRRVRCRQNIAPRWGLVTRGTAQL